MKQVFTVLQGRKIQITFTLFLIFSAIWSIGPYLAIAGKMPFSSAFSRIIASAVSCLLVFVIEYQRNSKNLSGTTEWVPDEIKQELQTLQTALKNASKILYKNAITSFFFRYKKPWFLILGPTSCGKSTLLTKAELNIKGLDNLPPMTIAPTKFFNWWLGDDAVFIDVGGRYLRENNERNSQLLFQGFFKLLQRFRPHKPINGLILMINLQELILNTKEQPQLKRLRDIISELLTQFHGFPIYIFVTRTDTVEGFIEFFEDLGPEERDQIFGIHFPLTTTPQSLPQLFNEQYHCLLERLHERVIWRLHQEQNLDKLDKIKNFPLQMEFLKNPLAKLLNLLLPNTHLNLRGIYFTSALQKDIPFDNLTHTLSSAYNIPPINNHSRMLPSKIFFIPQVFKRIIFPEIKFYAGNKQSRFRLLLSCIILFASGLCVFAFHKSYQHNKDIIANAKVVISAIKQPLTETNDPLLSQLDILKKIITELDTSSPWYLHTGMQQANHLKNNAQHIYNQLLNTTFLHYLQHTLESELVRLKENDTNQLYATLKTYLMLADRKHFDKKYFISWFDNYWHFTQDDPSKQQNLVQHLTALVEQSSPILPIDTSLIGNTRSILNSMPASKLVLTLLQNQYQPPVQLLPNTSSSFFKNVPKEIPGIYNIANFRNVYYAEIRNTCKEIASGDWVLGKRQQIPFSELTLNQLETEVKAIYLNEYATIWSNILQKIKIEEFQTLNQIVDLLDLLNNPQSILAQLITTIKNNTQPISDSIEFTQLVSSRFLSLNQLSADILKNSNQTSLMSLKEYLTKITQTNDIERASFDLAKVRMENRGENDIIATLLHQAILRQRLLLFQRYDHNEVFFLSQIHLVSRCAHVRVPSLHNVITHRLNWRIDWDQLWTLLR